MGVVMSEAVAGGGAVGGGLHHHELVAARRGGALPVGGGYLNRSAPYGVSLPVGGRPAGTAIAEEIGKKDDPGTLLLFGYSEKTEGRYKHKVNPDGTLEELITFTEPDTFLYCDELRDVVMKMVHGSVPPAITLYRDDPERGDVRLRACTDVSPMYVFNTRRDCEVEASCKFARGFWLFTPDFGDHYDSGGRLAGWAARAPQFTGHIKYLGRLGDEQVSEGGRVSIEDAFKMARQRGIFRVVALGCKGVGEV